MSCFRYLLIAAAAPLALIAPPALGVPWHLDVLDQMNLPFDNWYSPCGTGETVHVYIVSTGIDYTLPEFEGRAYPLYDAFLEPTSPEYGRDSTGHGTWLASIVAGHEYGVAKSAYVVGVRAFDDCGATTPDVLADALQTIASNGMRPGIVLLPFAFEPSPEVDEAVQALINAGLPVVAAAGDVATDAHVFSPGSNTAVITAGAMDTSFARASWSAYGSVIDLYAPGENIAAAWPSPEGTRTLDGTAASAAIVAGAGAVWLGSDPYLTPSQLEYELVRCADSRPTFSYVYVSCSPCLGWPWPLGGSDVSEIPVAPAGEGDGGPETWYRLYDEPCPSDLGCDGQVAFADLTQLLAAWGPCAGCPEDLDGDGEVGFIDLTVLLVNWGPCAVN